MVTSLLGELGEKHELAAGVAFTETVDHINLAPAFSQSSNKRVLI